MVRSSTPIGAASRDGRGGELNRAIGTWGVAFWCVVITSCATDPEDLVEDLGHPGRRESARQLLLLAKDRAVVPLLKALADIDWLLEHQTDVIDVTRLRELRQQVEQAKASQQ